MIPPVKLSAAERIINALAFVPRKRGEDFMARHKKEADAMRPIIEDVRREGVVEGLRMAMEAVATDDPKDAWAELSIRAEIERLKGES